VCHKNSATEAASHGQPETSDGYKGTARNTRGKVDRIAVGPIEVASPEVVFGGRAPAATEGPGNSTSAMVS
jgi:hypothetical protein